MITREVRAPAETGSAALWVMFMSLAALLLLGLVVDGGGAMSARRDASVSAEQAARVAADQLDLDSVRTGGDHVNTGQAVAAGQGYLRRLGAQGQVTVAGPVATVTVRDRYATKMLSIVGATSFDVSGTGRARAISDDTDPEIAPGDR